MDARSKLRARRGAAALAAALALAWPGRLAAQYTDPPAPAAYALRGVTVVQADGRRQEGVTLIVRGRFVEAIGAGIEIPADAQILEGDSLVVYPGLVDAQGTAAYEFPKVEVDRREVASWDPPRALQGFTPHRRVVDVLQATGASLAAQRKKGVVAAAVHPTDAMMPGRGALLLFRKSVKAPNELVLDPVLGPVFTFRGGQGVYPGTLFGVLAFYRQSFEDATRLRRVAAEYARDPRGLTPPPFDPDYAVLQEVMGGGTPVYFAADLAEDIRRALDLAERYQLRPVIVGGREAWRVADRLKAANVPVLVSLDFPKPQLWKPDAKKDTGAAGLDAAVLQEKRRIEEAYANPAKLAAAGVRFALTSGGGKADLREGARKAIEYGLTEDAALRAVTATPAELYGVGHLARIEVGLPATFVVANGPLFAEATRVVYTFVEGALEKGDAGKARANGEKPAVVLTGTWETDLETADGKLSGRMTLEQQGSTFSGTLSTVEFGELRIRNGTVSGDRIRFTVVVDAGGQTLELEFGGTAKGDEMTGSGNSPMGTVTFTARRSSGPGGDR